MGQNSSISYFGRRFLYFVVFAIVTAVLLSGSWWILNFVYDQVAVVDDTNAQAGIFINYSPPTTDYIDPASLVAMATYMAANPEPQNVQVLVGLSTAEISAYMVGQVAAGLQVDCTHCHNTENFSADEWDDPVAMENRVKARAHLRMTADINQNWLSQLATLTDEKHPSGAQVSCATCHLGEAQPVAWAADQQGVPDSFRLPLDDLTILQVTAREDISLDTVQINQQTMYHMNDSLNVGCTHCHNSRYFPGFDQPAKYYAQHMLNMAQHIRDNYSEYWGEQEPSCNLCHRNNTLPPGAVRSASLMPSPLVADQAVSQR